MEALNKDQSARYKIVLLQKGRGAVVDTHPNERGNQEPILSFKVDNEMTMLQFLRLISLAKLTHGINLCDINFSEEDVNAILDSV